MDGALDLFLVPGLIVVGALSGVIWLIVRAVRQESALRAREERLLREGARTQALVLRVHPRNESAWVFDVQIPAGATCFEARVEQLLTPHIAAGLHPGRVVLVRFDPRHAHEAVFDLAAMGYLAR